MGHWKIPELQSLWKLFFCKQSFKNLNKDDEFCCFSSHSGHSIKRFPSVEKLKMNINGSSGEGKTVVCDLEGTLLRSRCWFPYFMLVSLEAGGPVRALILLLLWPFLWALKGGISEQWALRVMIFVSFVGIKAKEVEIVSRGVLPRFYMGDLQGEAFKILVGWEGVKWVVSESPRVMIEGFLSEYLGVGVDNVVGTELHQVGGRFTGLVRGYGVVWGANKVHALKEAMGEEVPHLGIGDSCYDYPFLSFCKEAYRVTNTKVKAVPKQDFPKPLIFHDGRLVMRPTPANAVAVLLWLPIGVVLAVTRMLVGVCLPYKLAVPAGSLLGVRTRIRGVPPLPRPRLRGFTARDDGDCGHRHDTGTGDPQNDSTGVLYVCTHRTLMDPLFIATALRLRNVTAVTYSVSPVSALLAPIRTVSLRRQREADSRTMRRLLGDGDLVVCPEGTTCREPFLLRFSCLFAELSDEIVPVAVDARVGMFYGTTARGYKWLDPFFFLMNPVPEYYVHFLPKVPAEMTCGAGGVSSAEVANFVQRTLAEALGFECTSFTRRDKYLMLAGNDGIVGSSHAKKKLRRFGVGNLLRVFLRRR